MKNVIHNDVQVYPFRLLYKTSHLSELTLEGENSILSSEFLENSTEGIKFVF